MGKIKQGILGGFNGKVANVIGSSWKGIGYMRSMPLSVANPRTTKQVGQRERFKDITLLASELLSAGLRVLWDRFAVKMSGYNSFCKANKTAFSTAGVFNPTSLVWATGKMAATDLMGVAGSTNDLLIASWSTTLVDAYQQATDLCYIVIIGVDGTLKGFVNGVARSAGTADIEPLAGRSFADGDYAYMAFVREDGTIVSDSDYDVVSIA